MDMAVQQRRVGIFLAFQQNNPEWTKLKVEGPLERIRTEAQKARRQYALPPSVQTRKEALALIMARLHRSPLPLTRRHQDWVREFDINFDTTQLRILKQGLRSGVMSFVWKLLNGALPLGSHFTKELCPYANKPRTRQICSDKTRHVLEAQSSLPFSKPTTTAHSKRQCSAHGLFGKPDAGQSTTRVDER